MSKADPYSGRGVRQPSGPVPDRRDTATDKVQTLSQHFRAAHNSAYKRFESLVKETGKGKRYESLFPSDRGKGLIEEANNFIQQEFFRLLENDQGENRRSAENVFEIYWEFRDKITEIENKGMRMLVLGYTTQFFEDFVDKRYKELHQIWASLLDRPGKAEWRRGVLVNYIGQKIHRMEIPPKEGEKPEELPTASQWVERPVAREIKKAMKAWGEVSGTEQFQFQMLIDLACRVGNVEGLDSYDAEGEPTAPIYMV